MKNLLWIVLAAIVLIGGYVLVTGKSPSEIIDTGSSDAVEAPEALPDAVDGATDTANEAADAVADTANEAADAAADAANEAADKAAEAGNEAADVAAEAAENAAEAASDAADAASDAIEAATDSAAENADNAAVEAEGPLSVQNFDMDSAVQMIDNSNIDDTQKTLLKSSLKQAQDNPELLKAALDQVRAALGM